MSSAWKKRIVGVTALGAASVIALTGCLGGGGGASSGGEEGVIRIASAETSDAAIAALQAAGDRYEEETGVEVIVEAVPLTDVYTKVNSVYGTRAAYSAFLTGYTGHIQLLQGEGKLVPVDDVIDALGGAEDFYDGDVLFPIDGKTYWVPFDYNLAFGIIRTDWLEQVGMEIPTTWDELLAVAEAFDDISSSSNGLIMPLKADDSSNWITSQALWANDVEIFDDSWDVVLDEGENGERMTESLELLSQLYAHMPDSADNATYGDVIETFLSEQVGMTFYTGRIFDNILDQKPELIDQVKIFGFPTADGEGVTAGLGQDGIAVLNTENSDETVKFVEWWFQNGLVDLYATGPLHYQPAQRSMWENAEWRALPTIAEYGERLMDPQEELLVTARLGSIDSSGPEPDFRTGKVFQSMLFPEAYQKVTFGGEAPADVTTWLAEQVRTTIK